MNQKVNLHEVLPINPQSIVSRTLLEKENGTITLFSFNQGEKISEHKAPFWAMIVILSGQAELTIENEKQILQTGEIFIINPGEQHGLYAINPFKMLLFMLKN